ncbi:MAG: CPBP family intramembrane glutamic endopeptidase [Salinimicrobium sediminis]|nr:CPBP family intramembrane glutamic endopeptidase [Salinimicrobium sediminis]
MTITKAGIYFVGLVATMLTSAIAALYLLDLFENDLTEEGFKHLFGLITWLAPLTAYAIMFKISGFKLSLRAAPEKISALKPEFLVYVLFIAIGLELIERPLFDFEKIWNFYLLEKAEPYHFPEADRFIFYEGIFAILLAPVLEELFFRKYLFGELLKKYSVTTAMLISSLCFSLLHISSLRNLLPAFLLGMIACIIYKRTGNIFYTIILHSLANILWFSLQYLGEPFYNWIFGLKYNYIFWMMFLLGIVITYFAMSKIKNVSSNFD